MTVLRTLLSDRPDMGLADRTRQVSPAALAGLVAALQDRLGREGLTGARLCLPLDSSLGALAVLLAVLGSRASAALIPRPGAAETPDWPGFCQAVLLPPDLPAEGDFDLVAVAGSAELIRLKGATDADQGQDRVYLRTSGTTGTPKWAVHETASLLDNARACVTRLELSQQDRVMIPVPIHHMYGLGAALLPSLLAGASIALVPRGNPLEIFRAQRAVDPTAVFLVPSQCRSIMALNRGIVPRRLTVLAGDKLAPDEALLAYNLAQVLARSGKAEKALAELQIALRENLADEGTGPFELLAEVLQKLGKQNELVGRLEKLHAAQPDNIPLGYRCVNVAKGNRGRRSRQLPLIQYLNRRHYHI
ncbi:hypothetical protein LCGC14_2611460 [marine sediment metagenome]|uniref:AMP-dependent synthetase/ligase domain-containing protein n=1 Tax=marine sediment metagenome TaxID=412755 RepID=A0A0F9A5R6_9ZZZZ